ncbi:MAG: oligosaccharide flippase family protein [Ruminiclostridium sp.]
MIKSILKNQFFYSVASKVILAFLGVLNMVFINRLLGPTLRGEYAYILNIMNLATLFLNLGIYHSYPYFRRKNIDNLVEKYINNVVLQLIIYTSISLILCYISRDKKLIIIFTLIPLMILNRQINFIVMIEDINLRNRINILTEFLYTIGVLAAYLLTLQSLVIFFLLLYFRAIVQIVSAVLIFKIKISIKFIDLKLLFDSIKIGFVSMLSLLMITLNYKVDVLILKLFTDYTQIGLYSVGVVLAEQAWLISDAFKEVLFSKSARKDNINEILISLKINIVLTIFMFIVIAIFGQELIVILFGKEFAGSYLVTVILFAGIIGMVMFKMIYPLFVATGKQNTCLLVLSGSVVINCIFNFSLIPQFGIVGSAAASVLSYNACGWIFMTIFCKQYNLKILNSLLPTIKDAKELKNWINTKLKYKRGEYNYE